MAKSTLDLIYYGAIEAISEKGYNETTMDFIAERSGVAKGTLYYNFKSKDELFVYVMKRGIQRLTAVTAEVFGREIGVLQKWEALIQEQLDFFEQNRSFFRLLMQDLWGPNLQMQISLQQLLGDYFHMIDQELERARDGGWLSRELDIQTLSGSIFGSLTIPAVRAVLHGQPINEEKRVRSITYIVMKSLRGGNADEQKAVVD